MDYKETLNLPKTSFPMKAKLTELEPKLLATWKEMNLYDLILEKGRSLPVWVLHDGPPYANGNIHLGTALNKILKDIIIKSKTLQGFHSPYVPGWDCHGLPIENKVDKSLGPKKKDLSISQVRRLCREYAEKYLDIQRQEFIRLGVFGLWEDPYLTMTKRYEAIIARELGKTVLDGRMVRNLKPVLWCGSCQTALAEAEVEYQDDTSLSIYVPFQLHSEANALSPSLAGRTDVYFVIWTTTPWTIPSNMGIAYNPKIVYGAFEAGGRVLILAREKAKELLEKFQLPLDKDLGDIDNTNLKGLVALHPLYHRHSILVPALYVTLEQGTGLVHTAPGHGREDFETGKAYGLPVFSPLDNQARFTDEVPDLAGIPVLDANDKVIVMLKEKGALLAEEKLRHQYPHCWRCKNPVVFRATPQWFILMDTLDLREKSLEAIDTVKWIPPRGRDRIYGMIENRPDWCVSRQRSWGVPITMFQCDSCGQWLYTQEILDHIFKLFVEKGADAWFELDTKQLLPPDQKCTSCGGTNFTKETDILDVWFDSGSSFAAVMEDRDYLPDIANMYLEGSDQHRGWFHSSLLISEANRGRAPYREVLTHGYVVDGQGKKMSKSMGNTIEPNTIIKKYGADILRLWVASEDYQDDIRVSNQILDMLVKAYFNFRNTCRFILGNLFDFDPEKDSVPLKDISHPLDKYTLGTLATLVEKVISAYNNYDFHDVYHGVNNYLGNLSSFYLDVLKDRLYTFKATDIVRRESQTVMYLILEAIIKLMAPILSFTAEEIWGYLPQVKGRDASVFLSSFPVPDLSTIDAGLKGDMEALIAIRSQTNKSLEEARAAKLIGSSLDAQLTIKANGEKMELLKKYQGFLTELFIVSKVTLTPQDDAPKDSILVLVEPSTDPKCPRCWNRHPDVKEGGVCPKCQKALA
ncbi:MAG: isoleucine--tRNA ligase [Deltaproteobacteria bacterium]|jgi:isoleucyl-tRNA synthetase|nr:isoleucine--tRNA ligase [Deltaproteobacteria bacterium]